MSEEQTAAQTGNELYDTDYSKYETGGDFTQAVGGQTVELKLGSVAAAVNDNGKAYINFRWDFVNPTTVKKMGEGPLGSVWDKVYTTTPAGINGFLRPIVEAFEVSFLDFMTRIRGLGTGDASVPPDQRFATDAAQVLQEFVQAETTVRNTVKYVKSYTDKEGNVVALKAPRNEIGRFVLPKKS